MPAPVSGCLISDHRAKAGFRTSGLLTSRSRWGLYALHALRSGFRQFLENKGGGQRGCLGPGSVVGAEHQLLAAPAVKSEPAAIEGQKPFAGARAENSYSGTGKDVVEPVAPVEYAHDSDSRGDGIARQSYPWSIFLAQEFRSEEGGSGMTGGE